MAEFIWQTRFWDSSLCGTGAVYRLERRFAELVRHPYALAVSNCTLGLLAVFTALEIYDSEVITTPYTWGGTLAALTLTGNIPVFADINPTTLTLDPDCVLKCITPKTRAILAVDIYGYPCDGYNLRSIADEHGLILIQDCAQSFGAYQGKHHTGWWSDAAVFSLSWGKALFAGEGGIIVTSNKELYKKLVWKTQHPNRQIRDIPDQPVNEMALNVRIHPISAVWAEIIFDNALSYVEHRGRLGLEILKILSAQGVSLIKKLNIDNYKPAFHVLTVEPIESEKEIDNFLATHSMHFLTSAPPVQELVYNHTMYRKYSDLFNWSEPNSCPVAENQCRQRLRLSYNTELSRSHG